MHSTPQYSFAFSDPASRHEVIEADWQFPANVIEVQIAVHDRMIALFTEPLFEEVLEIAGTLSGGTLRSLIGSKILDGVRLPLGNIISTRKHTYAFLSDVVVEDPLLPDEWTLVKNRDGFPKAIRQESPIEGIQGALKKQISVSVAPTSEKYHIRTNGLPPTFRNYVDGAPLNIHAALVTVNEQAPYAHPAFYQALHDRTVRPHNLPSLINHARTRRLDPWDYMISKAAQLEFYIDPTDEPLIRSAEERYDLSQALSTKPL